MPKKIDYLTEDDEIPGQVWYCVSFLSPEGIRNCSMRGLKVRGVYPTEDQANKRAKELQEIDPDFHVFVGQVGKWCPWDPDPKTSTDQVYREEELQKLMKSYKENRQKAKRMEQERKDTLLNRSMEDERTAKRRERLQKKLQQHQERERELENISTGNTPSKSSKKRKKKRKSEKSSDLENVINNIEPHVKNDAEQLTIAQEGIKNQEDKVANLNDNLERIKKLYEKLIK